jgi:hypothetical protein
MNHDQQSILAAYDDAIKKLYATLADGYAAAAGDLTQEQAAEQNFKRGVGIAQRARDRALTLVS